MANHINIVICVAMVLLQVYSTFGSPVPRTEIIEFGTNYIEDEPIVDLYQQIYPSGEFKLRENEYDSKKLSKPIVIGNGQIDQLRRLRRSPYYNYGYSYNNGRSHGSGYGHGSRYNHCHNCHHHVRPLGAAVVVGGAALAGGLIGSAVGK